MRCSQLDWHTKREWLGERELWQLHLMWFWMQAILSLWHEQSAFQSVGQYKQHYFLFFFSFFFCFFLSIVYFSHRRSARIKKLNLWKLTEAPEKLGGRHLSRPRQSFLGPPRMVTHQKDVYHILRILHLYLTHKTNFRWQLPSLGWWPTERKCSTDLEFCTYT